MSDLISRADAIEALLKKLQEWDSYDCEDFRKGLYEAQDILEALPSAEGGDADMTVIPEGTGLMKPCPNNGADLISRQDAVTTIKRYKHRLQGKGQTYGFLLEEFEHQIPSAEAVHGEWIYGTDPITGEKDCKAWTCSLCGGKYPWQPNFCPNCGARMTLYKGGDDE